MSMTAKYTSSGAILATIDGVDMTIPNDPRNRHYAELIASGVTIEPLAVPTIAEIRAQASAAMIQRIEQFTAQFTSKYPSAEVASWGTQAAEARTVIAGGSSVIIAAFAATRGVTELEMATRIAAKSEAYMTIIGKVAGLRDATFDAIEAAETPEQVQAALDGAMAQAQGMAKAMGLEF
jgi:hypothetical protein